VDASSTPSDGTPGSNPPVSALIKIAHASKLFLALKSDVATWVGARPYSEIANFSDDRLQWSLHLKVGAPPPTQDWSAQVGDTLHNLRSALNAAIWDYANRNRQEIRHPKLVQFPIVEGANDWPNEAKKRLQGIAPEIVERIKNIQPFNRPLEERAQDALLLLENLNNHDKHRSVIVAKLTPQAIEHTFEVEFASDLAAARNSPPDVTIHVPDFSEDALLVEYRARDPITKVKGGFDVVFELWVETASGLQPLFQTLDSLIRYVNIVLSVMHDGEARDYPRALTQSPGSSN